ncbi:MAG: hypothetical protein WBZ51_32780 [Xanthobacteraceae bacterium]|jgi:hypothetical protein
MPLGRAALDFHVQQRDRQYKVVVLGSLTQPPLGRRTTEKIHEFAPLHL